MTTGRLMFGDRQIDPASNTVGSDAVTRQLAPRDMEVLLYLCQRQGEVQSAQQLLQNCGKGCVWHSH